MRDVHRDRGLAPDADGLAHRVRDHVRLAADVRDVRPAAPGERPGDRDELLGPRVQTGRVDEARRNAGCALRERGVGQPRHRPQLGGGRRAILEAEHRGANAPVADERRDVREHARARHGGAVGRQIGPGMRPGADEHPHERGHLIGVWAVRRERGESAVAADLRRDALAELGGLHVEIRVGQEHRDVTVGVRVDETRRDDVIGRVDRGRGRRGGEVSDHIDPAIADPDVGAPGSSAGAVNDQASADEHVDHRSAPSRKATTRAGYSYGCTRSAPT